MKRICILLVANWILFSLFMAGCGTPTSPIIDSTPSTLTTEPKSDGGNIVTEPINGIDANQIVLRAFRPMENVDLSQVRRQFQWIGSIKNVTFAGTIGEVVDECTSKGVMTTGPDGKPYMVAECTFSNLTRAQWASPKLVTFNHASGAVVKKLITPDAPGSSQIPQDAVVVNNLSSLLADIFIEIARVNFSGMFYAMPFSILQLTEQALLKDSDVAKALKDNNLTSTIVKKAFNENLDKFPLLGNRAACLPTKPYAGSLSEGSFNFVGTTHIDFPDSATETAGPIASATIDENCQLDSVNGINFLGLTAGGTPVATLEAGQQVITQFTSTDAPVSDASLSQFLPINSLSGLKGVHCEAKHHKTPSGTEDVDVKWDWIQLSNGESRDNDVLYHTMPFVAQVMRLENDKDATVDVLSDTRTCYGPFNELVTYPDNGAVGDAPNDKTHSVVFWEDGALNGALPNATTNVFLITVPGIRDGSLRDNASIVLRDNYHFGVGVGADGIKDNICVQFRKNLKLEKRDSDKITTTSLMHVIGAINGAIPSDSLIVFDACDQMQGILPNTGLEGTRVSDTNHPLTPVEVLFSCAYSNAFANPKVMDFMGDPEITNLGNFNQGYQPNVFVAGSLGFHTDWKITKSGTSNILATIQSGPQGQTSLAIPDLVEGDKLTFTANDSDLPGKFSFEVPVTQSCSM